MKTRKTAGIALVCSACLLMTLSLGVRAQEPGAPSASPTASAPPADGAARKNDGRYRIGPGDVIEIRTIAGGKFIPELSRESVRIDNSGTIRIPMFPNLEIQAACLTEGELAEEIRQKYLKFKREPYVDVYVKEYHSKVVAVIGAVSKPGQFQLQREIRLGELVNVWAGGPSERAGAFIQVIHSGGAPTCSTQDRPVTEADLGGSIDTYKLSATLKGDLGANPLLLAGDVINIQEAPEAYVVGNVLRPTAIQLKEPITISRAIAMAGGTMPDTKSDKVRIIRQLPGSTTKTEMFIDLKAIDKQRAEDVALQAGDIVDVPTSGGKRLLRSLVGTIAPTIGQLPVQIVR